MGAEVGQAQEGEGPAQDPHCSKATTTWPSIFSSRDLGEGELPSRDLLKTNLKSGCFCGLCADLRAPCPKYYPHLPDIPPLILIPLGLATFQEALIKMQILV